MFHLIYEHKFLALHLQLRFQSLQLHIDQQYQLYEQIC